MSLSPEDLLQISSKLREIENVNVHVTEFVYGAHRIMVSWNDSNKPLVIGIMRAGEPKSHGNLRDGNLRPTIQMGP